MAMAKIDLTGQTIGGKYIIRDSGQRKKNATSSMPLWEVRCVTCGKKVLMTRSAIISSQAMNCCKGFKGGGRKRMNKTKPVEKQVHCNFNEGVNCSGGNCEKCGWRPKI